MQEPVTQILHCDAMQYFLFFHLSVSLVATEMKLLFFFYTLVIAVLFIRN